VALDNREHRYEALWHLDAPHLLSEPAKGIYETQSTGGANLRIVMQTGEGLECRVVQGQEKPVVQGWLPLAYGRRGVRPIPCVICSRSGQRVGFLTVFQPLQKADGPRVCNTTLRDESVEMTWDNSKKTTLRWPIWTEQARRD
jgi:hypothetical protein